MMRKSPLNHQEKDERGFWLSSQRHKLEQLIFSLLILFLPTQLGKHFWPEFSILIGLRVDYLSPTLYITDILVAVLFLLWISRKTYVFRTRQFFVFLFICLFLLVTIVVNGNIANGVYHLVKFVELSFIGYYVAETIATARQFEKITRLLSYGVVAESALAIAQYFHQGSIGGLLYFLGERSFAAETPGIANASLGGELILRPYGTFSHPNVLAGYLLIGMIFILFTFLQKTKASLVKGLYLFSLCVGTAGILLSLSRVAILVWILILVFVGARSLNKATFFQKRIHILLHYGILLLCAIVFFFSPLSNRFFHISMTDEAVVQRELLIHKAANIISSHPLFGIGFGNFLPFLAKDSIFSKQAFLQPVHNVFLLFTSEIGIVGSIIAVTLFIVTVRRLVGVIKAKTRSMWIYQSLVACLVAVLILGQFDHYFLTLQQGQLLLSLVIGLCWTKIMAHNT